MADVDQINQILYYVLHAFKPEEWSAISVLLSVIATAGIVFGFISIREMQRNSRLSGAKALYEELKLIENDRKDVIKKITNNLDPNSTSFDPSSLDISIFDENDIKAIVNVINSCNRIGQLVETKTIGQEYTLKICYPALIQNWAICKSYADNYQKKIGIPYARRVERIDKMAKNYFDANRNSFDESINLVGNNNAFLVHKTEIRPGVQGLQQRLKWWVMRVSGNYMEKRNSTK